MITQVNSLYTEIEVTQLLPKTCFEGTEDVKRKAEFKFFHHIQY